MKIKYYLRGIGIGIIVTTLILSFSKTELTDQDIIDMAGKLGMVMKEDPRGNLDDVYAQLDKDKNSADTPLKDDNLDSNPSSKEEENPSTAEEQETAEKPSTNDEEIIDDTKNEESHSGEEDNETVVERISFYIPEGMSSDRVSQLLEDMEVISDAHDFNDYIISAGKSKRIRTGTFSLESNASYEEILQVITKEGE